MLQLLMQVYKKCSKMVAVLGSGNSAIGTGAEHGLFKSGY